MTDRPRLPVLSLAALLLAAGGFGLILGLRAIPPGETEIIIAVAAEYVAETGGDPTHCSARPSPVSVIHLIVTCTDGAGDPWQRAVDRYGQPVGVAPDLLTEESQT